MAEKYQLLEIKQPVKMPIKVYPRDQTPKALDDWKNARAIRESVYAPLTKPLMDLYKNILIDGHAKTIVRQRVLQITNINWTFTVDGEPYEPISEFTDKLFFKNLLKYIQEAPLYGFSLIELDFQNQTCELIPREHVVPECNAVLPDPYLVSNGVDYTKPPYDRTTFLVGEMWDLGLLFCVAPNVLLKRGDVSDWATFNEVFGMPSRVYFYDPNIPGNYDEVSKQASQTGANSWAVLPVGSDMKQESVAGKAGNETYKIFANFLNAEMSKTILGQTMTTENGSSRSQGEVHAETEDAINADDRLQVQAVLNETVIAILKKQGFDIPKGGRFHAHEEDEELTPQEQLDMDLLLHKDVAKLPLDYFEKKYNVKFDPNQPKPVEQESVKPEKEPKKTNPKNVIKASRGAKGLSEWLEKTFFA